VFQEYVKGATPPVGLAVAEPSQYPKQELTGAGGVMLTISDVGFVNTIDPLQY
jgi:hypothetical protein